MSYYEEERDKNLLREIQRIGDALEKIEAALKKDDAPAKEAVVEVEAEPKTCNGCRYREPCFVYDALSPLGRAECRCTLYAKKCKEACPQFERR